MRWGLVGTGTWARTVHAPGLAADPESRRLVAVWGRDAGRTRELAQAHGAQAAESFDALLDQVDAVSLAVAPDAQVALAGRALARGLRVVLEKPVGRSRADVQHLLDVQAPGSRAVVFLTRVFEATRAGWLRRELGRPWTHAEVEMVSGALQPGSPYAGSVWRQGPGVLWDLAPHALSQVVPLLGDVVDGSVDRWPGRDGVVVELRHDGGGTTSLRLTLTAEPDEKHEHVSLSGPAGSSRSPEAPLDMAGAYRSALIAAEADDDLERDPLLRSATLVSARDHTGLLSRLARAYDPPAPALTTSGGT